MAIVKVDIKGDSTSAQRAIESVQKGIQKLDGGKIASISNALSGMASGATSATNALGAISGALANGFGVAGMAIGAVVTAVATLIEKFDLFGASIDENLNKVKELQDSFDTKNAEKIMQIEADLITLNDDEFKSKYKNTKEYIKLHKQEIATYENTNSQLIANKKQIRENSKEIERLQGQLASYIVNQNKLSFSSQGVDIYNEAIENTQKKIKSLSNANHELIATNKELTNTFVANPIKENQSKENKTKIEPILAEGSVALLKKEITDLNKQFEAATTDADRITINAKIKLKETELEAIKVRIANEKIEPIQLTADIDISKIKPKLSEVKEATEAATSKGTWNNEQDAVDGVSAAFTSASSALTTFAGESEGAAAAQRALAMAEQLAAMASAIHTASSTGDPYTVAARIAAAVAAVVAGFAQMSRFADGGIVSGSKVGDRNLVRVNGGEMILNGSQQRNLFNLLNGTTSSNNNLPSNVQFKISGKDLVAVFNNYNKFNAKIK